MDSRLTGVLVILALASSAAAWSESADLYFCQTAASAVWGKAADECLKAFDVRDYDPIALSGLKQGGDCPIKDSGPAKYICVNSSQAYDKAYYWMGQAKSSMTLCERIQRFCVAANYIAQEHSPFARITGYDSQCEDIADRRINQAILGKQTTWTASQECSFNYSIPLAGGKLEKTYAQNIVVEDTVVEGIVANLTAEAKAIKNRPYATTTTTTSSTTTLPAPPKVSENATSCKVNGDCVLAKSGCCGCSEGGTNAALSKSFAPAWEKELSSGCASTSCPTVMSQHASCYAKAVCLDGACRLQIEADSLCADESLKLNCMGAAPSSTPGESKQYGVSCGYINFICQSKWQATTTTSRPPATTSTEAPTTTMKPTTTLAATTSTEAKAESGSNSLLYFIGLLIIVAGAYMVYLMLAGGVEKQPEGGGRRGLSGMSGRQDRIESYGASRLSSADEAPRPSKHIPLKEREIQQRKEAAAKPPEPVRPKHEESADVKTRRKVKSLLRDGEKDDSSLGRR